MYVPSWIHFSDWIICGVWGKQDVLKNIQLKIPWLIVIKCTTLWDKVCQWLMTGRWFSPGTPVPPQIKLKYCWKWC
jgi:hypothetical protein